MYMEIIKNLEQTEDLDKNRKLEKTSALIDL